MLKEQCDKNSLIVTVVNKTTYFVNTDISAERLAITVEVKYYSSIGATQHELATIQTQNKATETSLMLI